MQLGLQGLRGTNDVGFGGRVDVGESRSGSKDQFRSCCLLFGGVNGGM